MKTDDKADALISLQIQYANSLLFKLLRAKGKL